MFLLKLQALNSTEIKKNNNLNPLDRHGAKKVIFTA